MNAASVGDPGAAQYAMIRWPVSATCSTWHSNSRGASLRVVDELEHRAAGFHLVGVPHLGELC